MEEIEEYERYLGYYIEALKLLKLKSLDNKINFPYEWETENAIFRAESFTNVKVIPKKSVKFIKHSFTVLKSGENF